MKSASRIFLGLLVVSLTIAAIGKAASRRPGPAPELEQLHRWIFALDAVSQSDPETMSDCKVSGPEALQLLAELRPLWEEAVERKAARAKRRDFQQVRKACAKDPCACSLHAPVVEKVLAAAAGAGDAERASIREYEQSILAGAKALSADARLACARKYAKGGACRSPAFKRRLRDARGSIAPAAH
jgi:hypothetical protein